MIFANFILDRGRGICYTLLRMNERKLRGLIMNTQGEFRKIMILTFWAFVAMM